MLACSLCNCQDTSLFTYQSAKKWLPACLKSRGMAAGKLADQVVSSSKAVEVAAITGGIGSAAAKAGEHLPIFACGRLSDLLLMSTLNDAG